MIRRLLLVVVLLLASVSPLNAHPVPSFTYDRTIRVKLTPAGVEVAYRIELNDFTVLRDIDKLLDDATLGRLTSATLLRQAFIESIAPILADRLEAFQGERPLTFQLQRQTITIEDHLYCDFTFVAPWAEPIEPATRFRLEVTHPEQREEIHLEKGRLDVAFEPDPSMQLAEICEPSAALKDRPEVERDDQEDAALRQITALITPADDPAPATVIVEQPLSEGDDSTLTQLRRRGLVALLDSRLGVGLLLLLAGVFGAAHALTPGHGKTLVAAYLVGQRGTVAHALLLGLVTTLTHTGIVLLLAASLPWLLERIAPERVQAILGFAGGLLVAGMGVWLFLRRIAGQADHVHVGGGHHHHHGPGGHHHHHFPAGDRVRPWDLIVLGISGGIVPCWDAIALLAMAIGTRQVWLGLPLLLAFSAGLAGVLVLIGILVVKVKGFSTSRRGDGPIVRALPIVSAAAVTALGIWLCFSAATGG